MFEKYLSNLEGPGYLTTHFASFRKMKHRSINVVAPTCADDIAILASKEHEVQALLDIVHDLTNRDIVTINPLKSDLVPLTRTNQEISVKLGKIK